MAGSTRKPARLSHNAIQRASCPAGLPRIELPDSEIRGLRLFVTRGGVKTWYLTRKIAGRTVRVRLGEWPVLNPEAARQAAMAWLRGEQEETVEPARAATLSAVCKHAEETFWKGRVKKPDEARRQLTRYSPALLARSLDRIKRRDVRAIHAAIGKDHPTAANRWLEVMHRLFNIAELDFDYAGGNPAKGIETFNEVRRERRLEPAEAVRLLEVLADNPRRDADLVRLALFTAARRSNIFKATADQFDLESSIWTIPASAAKAGEAITLPLDRRAVAIVNRRIKAADSGWLFPGKRIGRPLADFTKPFAAILDQAEITGFRFHDLRRSLASFMADTGANEFTIGLALGHAVSGVTGRYARPLLEMVRKAIGKAIDSMEAGDGMVE